jgi:hypothetical protein
MLDLINTKIVVKIMLIRGINQKKKKKIKIQKQKILIQENLKK